MPASCSSEVSSSPTMRGVWSRGEGARHKMMEQRLSNVKYQTRYSIKYMGCIFKKCFKGYEGVVGGHYTGRRMYGR